MVALGLGLRREAEHRGIVWPVPANRPLADVLVRNRRCNRRKRGHVSRFRAAHASVFTRLMVNPWRNITYPKKETRLGAEVACSLESFVLIQGVGRGLCEALLLLALALTTSSARFFARNMEHAQDARGRG